MKVIKPRPLEEREMPIIATECPYCGQISRFEPIKGTFDIIFDIRNSECNAPIFCITGQRHCPDNECLGHIFFVYDKFFETFTKIYPIIKRSNLKGNYYPKDILISYKEALKCYENECFFAAGVMIRKTLEQTLHNQGATEGMLHQKIETLYDQISLANPLREALKEIKFFGNDAAHVICENFEVNKNEVETALTIIERILTSLYEDPKIVSKFQSYKKKD